MTQTRIFKAPISLALTAIWLGGFLSSCKPSINQDVATLHPAETSQKLAPLQRALSCLPRNAAIIAAHRGTDERWAEKAENSLGALNALIQHGTLMAEIDVAGLRDGTLITFHDGVWDEISTAKGPIARSQKQDLDKILLKSRTGGLTTDRPPEFADILNAAKGKMYLEVDFKSSADPQSVISTIRKADMTDQVLLIAYTPNQAKLFDRLAPDMLRSNPPEASRKNHAVWMGYGVANGGGSKAAAYKNQDIFTIGRIGDPNRQPSFSQLRTAADILVTDQAERYDGITGLSRKDRSAYDVCLTQ